LSNPLGGHLLRADGRPGGGQARWWKRDGDNGFGGAHQLLIPIRYVPSGFVRAGGHRRLGSGRRRGSGLYQRMVLQRPQWRVCD